jgi:mono/diheme cytochrome c family protein
MKMIRIALGFGVALLAIQLVPVARTNPPVEASVEAPPEVTAILRRACFDCHSNETVWPPQAYVAPVSWLVAHDVKEGREELNFSRWGPDQAKRTAKELPKEVEKKDMPPFLYLLAHPGATLSAADRAALTTWARGLGEKRGQ